MPERIARATTVLAATLAGAALVLFAFVGSSRHAVAETSPSGALSITIDGNHFVNGPVRTIRLLGVDRPGTEYVGAGGHRRRWPAADARRPFGRVYMDWADEMGVSYPGAEGRAPALIGGRPGAR